MQCEFLLEIGTEEIPAGFIPPALQSLADLFTKALDQALIGYEGVETYATPRRLILRVAAVDSMQASRKIEKTGPSKAQAFDGEGNPTKAAMGFARGQGVEVGDLITIETPKGEVVAVRKTVEGQPTAQVLADVLPGIMEKIPFPKTMRWKDLDARFARPVHWIVALFDGNVVPFQFAEAQSGNATRGHRFTHPESRPVTSFESLRETLRQMGVMIDPGQRRDKIVQGINESTEKEGLEVFEDNELLDEITYLVESPYPVMGEFPRDFLELPASILITCMKKHQRYFAVHDSDSRITNRFIAVNNTPVKETAISVQGHERVLKARLEDARFYFLDDRKTPLINRLEALKGVVFHSKLGTSYEKVERFAHLACMLAERFIPKRVEEVRRAALLCKCDLETGIVYEFPELQGIIGSYYAGMDGEPEAIARAIREHYLPSHAGDSLPEGMIGSLVSVGDRLDTIVGCFSVGLKPSGAADPYGLRRNALGIIQVLIQLDRHLDLPEMVREAIKLIGDKRTREENEIEADVLEFIRTRFANFHTSRGYPLDVVEAAVRARFDDVVDARRRVEALSQWKTRDDFDAIMIGFKRVVNILKGTTPVTMSTDLLVEDAEKDLLKAFSQVRDRAAPHIHGGDYQKALEIIAELKIPIDSFFDNVMVMVDDQQVRDNRLGLLRRIADFFGEIADFSFIGSTAK